MNYFNYEVELISALMTSGTTPDAIEVIDKLTPDMIESPSLAKMMGAIIDLNSKGLDFDAINVSDKTGMLLSDITSMVISSSGSAVRVKAYAKRVRQGFYLRSARETFEGVIKHIDSCNDETQIGEISGMVENAVKNLVVETDSKKPRLARDIIEQYVDVIEDRFEGGEAQRRLKVGIEALDNMTQGFNQTDLIILGGAPGMGKTEFMVKLVNGASSEDAGGLIFSMEMDEYQLIERSISIESGLPISCARSPQGMDTSEWARFSAGMGVVTNKSFYVLDQAGLTINEICAKATEHKSRHPNMNLICLDYVGLIKLMSKERHDIALGEITRRLKQLAKDLKTPVVLLAQITSKDVEKRTNKRPMASDLKDSSRLQDDADWILFPYRDVVYNERSDAKDYAEIIIAKARHGSRGTVYMGWQNGHFTETNQEYAASICRQREETPMRKGF